MVHGTERQESLVEVRLKGDPSSEWAVSTSNTISRPNIGSFGCINIYLLTEPSEQDSCKEKKYNTKECT